MKTIDKIFIKFHLKFWHLKGKKSDTARKRILFWGKSLKYSEKQEGFFGVSKKKTTTTTKKIH